MSVSRMRGLNAESKSIAVATELNVRSSRVKRYETAGSGFHDHSETEEKRRQRSIVTEFMCEDPYKEMRMFSLPGLTWDVERNIHFSMKARFAACEKDSGVFVRSASQMPKNDPSHRAILETHDIEGIGRVNAFRTGRSSLFDCCAADFLNRKIKTSEWGLPSSDKCTERKYNSFWLDTFSPVGTEFYVSLIRGMVLHSSSDEGSSFALAFNLGRDSTVLMPVINACPGSTPLEKRSSFIHLMASRSGRQIEIVDAFTHKSWNEDGNVLIGTVLGKVLPK